MRYLTFIRHSESYRQSAPPAALMEAMGKFVERSMKDGTLVDTGGLLPSKEGARVRLANGKLTVTDGPFTESKEVIAGYTLVEAASLAEVVEWAKKWPQSDGHGEVELEIRQLYEIEDFGDAFSPELKADAERIMAKT